MGVHRNFPPPPLHRRLASEALAPQGIFALLERLSSRRRGGFILAFHDISTARMVEVIDALRPNEPVSLSELIERKKTSQSTTGLFAITFDDGVGETVRNTSKVLSERHWPATFYLPTAYLDQKKPLPFQWWRTVEPMLPEIMIQTAIGVIDLRKTSARDQLKQQLRKEMRTRPFDTYASFIESLVDQLVLQGISTREELTPPLAITWEEVSKLSKNPYLSFESHGISHTAVSALNSDELHNEFSTSQRRIEEHTNRPCRHFCFPYGSPESIGTLAPQLASQYYQSAVTMTRGRIDRHEDLWTLPRVPIHEPDTGNIARLKVITSS